MKPIFSNRSVGKQITVDLDVWWKYFFMREDQRLELLNGKLPADVEETMRAGITLYRSRDRLREIEQRIGLKTAAFYRKSSNGHVHLRIDFPCELSVLDAFMIRARMMDDQTRLALDMCRYLMTDDLNEMNRCFDAKGKLTPMLQISEAGPWIPIETDQPDISREQTELGFC
jgi:hypothetical protein